MAKAVEERQGSTVDTWPVEGLERVNECPVCGCEERNKVHEGLRDQVFFCAPGEWTLHRCQGCGSGYLDPRPTPETIHLAYESYYTHVVNDDFKSLGAIEKVRRILSNGYRNWRYQTQDSPSSHLGIIAALMMPRGRAILDAGMRHLPPAQPGQSLLDVGCGNGEFLIRAKSAGWKVKGLDFDPRAVEAAQTRNLDVQQGDIDSLSAFENEFDVITLSHVVEHVHQPLDLLKECHRLLKPGGFVWIETPNMSAEGHRYFGRNWRGLEPPRHLVLFTLDGMVTALKQIGFNTPTPQAHRPQCRQLFEASEAIAQGMDPYNSEARKLPAASQIRKADEMEYREPDKREFITIKAWKNSEH